MVKNRADLERKDLKHNFLKTIIIRFDFTGVAKVELDELIKDIKSLLHAKGYDRLTAEMSTEMDFQLDDPERFEMEGIPVRRQMVYVFKNQIEGISLKISSVFAFISIEETQYIDFFSYSSTLIEVMKLIKEKIPFFNPVRFGLRKINQCVLENIGLLNDYFEPLFYHLFFINEDSSEIIYQVKECIRHGDYNINLSRLVVQGEWDTNTVYQIVLDSDIYLSESDKVIELINNAKLLNPMNDLLFDIYKSVITESFIETLQQEQFIDTNIKGVEQNESV
jgi:uncharacterized protein (TIGR04255 family)